MTEQERSALQQMEPATEPVLQAQIVAPTKPRGLPTHLPLPLLVLSLAVWPLLEQLMSALVGFVDTLLAGRISPQATEAVGAAGYFMWLIGMLHGAVGIGATAVVSRNVGAGDYKTADHALGQSLTLASVWGVLTAILLAVLAGFVPVMLSIRDDSAWLCTAYLRWLSLATPCAAILFVGAAALRGAGDMRSAFVVMLLVNIVNAIASIALVRIGWGLHGVAVGTVIAWTVGAIAMLAILARGRAGVKLFKHDMRWHWPMMRRIVRVGVPALLENGGYWVGNFVVIVLAGYLAKLGLSERPLGSHIVAVRMEAFSFLMGMAFSIAAATLAGQYLGANDPHGARRAVRWAWGLGAGIMGVMGVLFMTIPDALVRIMTDQQPFVSVAPHLLFQAGWAQIGFATALILSGALRGAGDTKATMAMTFASTFLVRVPLVWLLAIHWRGGLVWLWVALAAELWFRGLIFVLRFVHGGWMRAKV